MDQVSVTAGLANRRHRPIGAVAVLAPLSALSRNPVAITLSGEGDLTVSAERGKNGKVWLTCGCAQGQADGWCKHRIDLLCFRYDDAPDLGAEDRRAFEQLVGGTSLQAAGQDADRALRAFEECLDIFDARRPKRVVGRDLAKFTDLVSDLASCASELEDALGTLRRLLERA